MDTQPKKGDIARHQKALRKTFSDYENAVNFISSFEEWFIYRWGTDGKVNPGLLDYFNRFPKYNTLTPDFEVRFKTPFVIWGDHKRSIQAVSSGRDDDVQQILKYATSNRGANADAAGHVTEPLNVVVVVPMDNDDAAAKAIQVGRTALSASAGNGQAKIAPIIVLGSYLDKESINGEWYKLKWRDHFDNGRFTVPNVSKDPAIEDLNKLLVDASHHAIRVSRRALDSTGQNPFINDNPPPIYTAMRLVVPAINSLLSEDDRDRLQSIGRIEKTLSAAEIITSKLVHGIRTIPIGILKWVGDALDFLVDELKYAKKVPKTSPSQYVVTIDNELINSDLADLFSARAAKTSVVRDAKLRKGKRSKIAGVGQMRLFEK